MMFSWRHRPSESAAASFSRLKSAVLNLPTSLALRTNQTLAPGGRGDHFGFHSLFAKAKEKRGWKKLDAEKLGIKSSMIPESTRVIIRRLKKEGFEAYLVGGCVRDLLLKRAPKDYDVVTTASLKQIRKNFRRAQIVGRRFPICRVSMKGSVVEVSSFDTVAGSGKKKEGNISQMSKGFAEMDLIRWKNCMTRDFTVNSLFFDPFALKIYDYCDAMMDLTSSKLRTLIPAQLSFKEDCARILRGLRIAARLGLSFSKDVETAVHKLHASVKDLDRGRLMLEMNYMLSYGAAAASLSLLQRFKLLDILLPFQAAYLTHPSTYLYEPANGSKMLMQLFSNLDKLVSCDLPCTSSLWIGLLAFHTALVVDPQDTLVVWTLCSVLYYGDWTEAVKVARRHAKERVNFVPEILKSFNEISDEELALRVSDFASTVQNSVDTVTNKDYLLETMARYPDSKCSSLVFVPKKAGNTAAQIFNVLVENSEDWTEKRESYEINYHFLGEGHILETRFALGKVIMDTLSSGVEVVEEADHAIGKLVMNTLQCGINVDKEAELPEHHQHPAEQETGPTEIVDSQSLGPANIEMKESTVKAKACWISQLDLRHHGVKQQMLSEKARRVVQSEDEILIFPVVEGGQQKKMAVESFKVVEKNLHLAEKAARKERALGKDGKETLTKETNGKLAKQKRQRRDFYGTDKVNEKEDTADQMETVDKLQICVKMEIANEEENEGLGHDSHKLKTAKKDVMVKEDRAMKAGEQELARVVSRRPSLYSLFRTQHTFFDK